MECSTEVCDLREQEYMALTAEDLENKTFTENFFISMELEAHNQQCEDVLKYAEEIIKLSEKRLAQVGDRFEDSEKILQYVNDVLDNFERKNEELALFHKKFQQNARNFTERTELAKRRNNEKPKHVLEVEKSLKALDDVEEKLSEKIEAAYKELEYWRRAVHHQESLYEQARSEVCELQAKMERLELTLEQCEAEHRARRAQQLAEVERQEKERIAAEEAENIRVEQERLRIEAAEEQKREEERRLKREEEEELKRQEEEKRKLEVERQKLEEEKKRLEALERVKNAEEEERKEQELKKMEEKKRQLEEERKRKELEKQRKAEEEDKRKRSRIEEELKKQQELKVLEEKKKKRQKAAEERRIRKEEEEKKRKEEMKKQEVEKRKNEERKMDEERRMKKEEVKKQKEEQEKENRRKLEEEKKLLKERKLLHDLNKKQNQEKDDLPKTPIKVLNRENSRNNLMKKAPSTPKAQTPTKKVERARSMTPIKMKKKNLDETIEEEDVFAF
uniref:Calponin homology domain-containing protein DDB_G0272472-like n=1 Tax=Bursaphelenchus xylophilus TaxID=6326 RepID=A0A1I7RR43_BURXY